MSGPGSAPDSDSPAAGRAAPKVVRFPQSYMRQGPTPGWIGIVAVEPKDLNELADYLENWLRHYVAFPERTKEYWRITKRLESSIASYTEREPNPRYVKARLGMARTTMLNAYRWLTHRGMLDIPPQPAASDNEHETERQLRDLAILVRRVANADAGPADPVTKQPPATGGAVLANGSTNQFQALLDFAKNNLKGIERRLVELVCEHGGECPIADVAADPAIGWSEPYDNPLNKTFGRINRKVRNAGLAWEFYRYNNAAKVKKTAAQNRPKKA
jgi:hypothetical protein